MVKNFKIQRCITYYEKNGDEYIADNVILEEDFSLDELKEIFGSFENDLLLYHQYNIDAEIAHKLNNKIEFVFDFEKYDYFLETFNVADDAELGNGIRLRDN